MKKIIILILIAVTIAISMIFVNYTEYRNKLAQVNKINKEFTVYENNIIQISTVITIMNKAIQLNTENDIQKDENNFFIENETNSIKVFLEIKSRGSVIPMEDLILGKKAGIEKVSFAFSDMLFQIGKIEYHEKTGQVKKITILAKEEIENT